MPGASRVLTSLGSGPQGSSKVRIRGQSSFGSNNSPLIVVNGVPIDNTTFGVSGDFSERGSNRNSDSGDGLSSINPDDVVDISVLKGAAAAALERLLWLNTGLDAGYVAVGVTLALTGWYLGRRASLMGAAIGIIVHGLALFIFDLRFVLVLSPHV